MTDVKQNSGDQKYLTVNDSTFQSEVLAADKPVLVDFWAAWCGPCRMIAPVIEELAGDYDGRATVAKLDVDANPETAARYGISSIPTVLVFKNGLVVDKVVGAVSKKSLAARLDSHLN